MIQSNESLKELNGIKFILDNWNNSSVIELTNFFSIKSMDEVIDLISQLDEHEKFPELLKNTAKIFFMKHIPQMKSNELKLWFQQKFDNDLIKVRKTTFDLLEPLLRFYENTIPSRMEAAKKERMSGGSGVEQQNLTNLLSIIEVLKDILKNKQEILENITKVPEKQEDSELEEIPENEVITPSLSEKKVINEDLVNLVNQIEKYEPTIISKSITNEMKKWDKDNITNPTEFGEFLYNIIRKQLNKSGVTPDIRSKYQYIVRDLVQGIMRATLDMKLPVDEVVKYLTTGVILFSTKSKDDLNFVTYIITRELILGSKNPKYSLGTCIKGLGRSIILLILYGVIQNNMFKEEETYEYIKEIMFQTIWDTIINVYKALKMAEMNTQSFLSGINSERTKILQQMSVQTNEGKTILQTQLKVQQHPPKSQLLQTLLKKKGELGKHKM